MRFASRRSPSQHQMPKIGLCTMGVPVSNANRIRFIEESTLSRWPSSQVDQVNDIHLKGLPLSTVNGIRFRGVPLSTANGIRINCVTLSKRMGFAPRGSPSPKRMVFSSRGFPLHSEWDSLQRIPLVNSEWNLHQLHHPLQENGIRTKRVTLSKANGIRIKRVTLSKANEIRTKGSPSPSEWDSHQEGHPLQSEWDSLLTSGLVAARDPFQGILLRGHATQGIPFSKGLRLCV